jgi:alpha-glucosidase
MRYELLPYLYTLTYLSSKTGEPILRPLVYAYQDDETTHRMGDEYLAGEDILVAPILDQMALMRRVYLPKGHWYDAFSKKPIQGPCWLDIPAPLDRLPMFIKAGSVIPKAKITDPSRALAPSGTILLEVYPKDDAETADSWLYLDDGLHRDPPYALFRFSVHGNTNGTVAIAIHKEGDYQGVETFTMKVYGKALRRVLQDGRPIPFEQGEDFSLFSVRAEPLKLELLDAA